MRAVPAFHAGELESSPNPSFTRRSWTRHPSDHGKAPADPACQHKNISDASTAAAGDREISLQGSGDANAAPGSALGTAPRYVRACATDAWRFHAVHKATGKHLIAVFRCFSRRHPGECRDAWRHRLYARLMAGRLATAHQENTVFVTFTLAAHWHRRSDRRAEGHVRISSEITRWTDAMQAWLRRRELPPMEYFWTREETARGVAHLHMVIVSRTLAEEVRTDREDAPMAAYSKGKPPGRWVELAQSTGVLGRMDASIARDGSAVASYVSKVTGRAHDHDPLAGELAKDSQSPEAMRRHQRSFGCSRDFLAPKQSASEDWIGWLEHANGRPLNPERAIANLRALGLRDAAHALAVAPLLRFERDGRATDEEAPKRDAIECLEDFTSEGEKRAAIRRCDDALDWRARSRAGP